MRPLLAERADLFEDKWHFAPSGADVAARILAEELGLPIEGPHEDDRFWIAQLDDDGKRWGMEAKSFEPTRWLKHGDTVTVGELTLDVIH